jgi:zona occludens toxin
MSASIFHGPPGSFKSASAFWFEVLPALRAGRIVVTNIEGILTKESIEIELNEVFPESSDIWRLSSQSEEGLFLWRRWFWWMPIGAFIIMDEVQDIFPNDSTVFKPAELDSKGIDSLRAHLPDSYYDYYQKTIKKFTPATDEGSVDDTGELILDENGLMLYPKNMREANMRHRKYNWDIIYCTPEITEIHKLVRAVCQYAYKYKYFDSLDFLPFFYRKPRYHEHSPKSNGESITKSTTIKWRKVPVEVHKCYRSTSTGDITKRRGVNILKDPTLIVAVALLLLSIGYMSWYFFIDESNSSNLVVDEKVINQTTSVPIQTTKRDSIASINNDVVSPSFSQSLSLNLPYNANTIIFNGHLNVIMNKTKKYKEYFFTLVSGQNEYSVNDTDLQYFGIKVHYINECAVELSSGNKKLIVYCSPKTINSEPVNETLSEKVVGSL